MDSAAPRGRAGVAVGLPVRPSGAPQAEPPPPDGPLTRACAALRPFVTALARRGPATLDPEDLLQDVMERALRYRHTLDPARDPLPWLRRTAYRVFLDACAADRRAPDALDALPEPLAPAVADRLALADEVAHLLAGLPAVQRQVLLRFHRDGLSVAELAAELGLPAGTVKSHLHRARRRMAVSTGDGLHDRASHVRDRDGNVGDLRTGDDGARDDGARGERAHDGPGGPPR